MKMQSYKTRFSGLTLVELLVALTITGVVLSAVATFSFALDSAGQGAEDVSSKQAGLRHATLRISELIKHCGVICKGDSRGVIIWRADDNDDDEINLGELTYIETDFNRNGITISRLDISAMAEEYSADWDDIINEAYRFSPGLEGNELLGQAGNVYFRFDTASPGTGFVSISFEQAENGITRHYQINAALRARAANLVNTDGTIITTGDDD